MQRKTNEQEIKKLEIELKRIKKILDEVRPIRDEYMNMLKALDIYEDLNMEEYDIESRLRELDVADKKTSSPLNQKGKPCI